jgi:hypothetical protein
MEDKMQEMRCQYDRENDTWKDKLDNVMDLRDALKESSKKPK